MGKGINGSDSTTTGKSALDKSDTTLATTTANNRASSLEEDSTNDLKNLEHDFATYPQEESPLEASVVTTPKKSRASEIVNFTDRGIGLNADNDDDENDNDDDDDENGEYVVCCCGMLRLKNLPLFISMN